MKIKNLTQIWICSPMRTNNFGEYETIWTYKETEQFNLQQDLNELDRNTVGEVDYSIYKARTDKDTVIEKGDGIYLTDISSSTNPTPDYTVKNSNKIGTTTVLTLNKYNGE